MVAVGQAKSAENADAAATGVTGGAGSTGEVVPAGDVVIEDGVAPGAGQISRSQFFSQLDRRVGDAVDDALRPVGRTSADCPYLARYLEHYRRQPVDRLNRAVRHYARPTTDDSEQWLTAVATRAGQAARTWARGSVDPLVRDMTPSGADDLSTSIRHADERTEPETILEQLGAGTPLAGGVRSRAETAFGVGFDRVRVHVDEVAARLASAARARAFTVGQHIGFAAGEYRPGSRVGDAVLAHELAHSLQQRGVAHQVGAGQRGDAAALERDADRTALAAGHRLLGRGDGNGAGAGDRGEATSRVRPRLTSALALRRCPDEPDTPEPAGSVLDPGPTGGQVGPGQTGGTTGSSGDRDAGAATAGSDQSVVIDDLRDWTWTLDADPDSAVVVVGETSGAPGPHLFLLPGRGLLSTGTPPGPPRQTTTGPAQRPALARMPATGHAGAHLVHTSQGLATMVDVGGNRTGSASAIQVSSIQAVAGRFGITSVNQVLASHVHADHVANLVSLVRSGVVQAANVHVLPGMQGSSVGPLGQVVTELQRTQHTANGFGPGWSPTALTAAQVAGPGGASVSQSQLRIGSATFDMVVDTAKMRAFVTALRANNWRQASGLADAASLMTRISGAGGGPQMLVTGDMRGRDILRVQQSMGEPAFRTFLQNVNTVSGLHHLGAVGRSSDVRGLRALLSGMGVGSGKQITVVAQTGGRGEINMNLVQALQRSGVRVVALREAQGRADQQITIGGSGRVLGQGASEWAPERAVRDAQQRLRRLERAITAIEATPTYRTGETMGRTETLTGLRAEAQRLRGLLVSRMELATGELTSSTRQADAATRLTANETALGRTSAAERALGSEEVLRLSRSAEAAGQLADGLRRAQRGGYARHEVLRLLHQVDPQTARQIMVDELGKPQSRRQQRRAWRQAARRLRRQAEINRIVQSSGGGTPRARGVALFGLALEAWNLASPFISGAVNDYREANRRDFYMFWRDLSWWWEKGMLPPYQAFANDQQIAAGTIPAAVERRIYDDLSSEDRDRFTLSDAARSATAVDKLVIPPLNQWPDDNQRSFWTRFTLWTSAHINNFEDYQSEIGDLSWAPVRMRTNEDVDFEQRTWEMRVGVVHDGHVREQWQESADLTRIMRATASRVIRGTNRQLAQRWSNRNNSRTGPVITVPGATVRPSRSEQPTAIRSFTSGRHNVYEQFGQTARQITGFRFWTDNPRFFLHADMEAPPGYVWVSGADYNTAAAIRSQDTALTVASVQIPRQPAPSLYETLPPSMEEYMSEEQLFAWRAQARNDPRFAFVESPHDRWYRGWVHYYERGPNEHGMLLVRLTSLSRRNIPTSELPWPADERER